MEHGMVVGGMPPFAAAGMYVLFGICLMAVVIYLQKRAPTNHEGDGDSPAAG